jgi:hypothetical protein
VQPPSRSRAFAAVLDPEYPLQVKYFKTSENQVTAIVNTGQGIFASAPFLGYKRTVFPAIA